MRRGVRLALSVRYIFFHEITRLLGTHLPLGHIKHKGYIMIRSEGSRCRN